MSIKQASCSVSKKLLVAGIVTGGSYHNIYFVHIREMGMTWTQILD